MTKKITAAERLRDDDFEGIVAGLESAIAIKEGRADAASYRIHAPEKVDVKSIRARMNLSQAEFASRFGLPKAAIVEWEQGRRRPDTGSRILLKVIEREPDAVLRALEG